MRFHHHSLGQRISFSAGEGVQDLLTAVERTGSTQPLLIASPSQGSWTDRATADMPVAHRIDEVRAHVPVELAQRARATAVRVGADLIVAIGGGSAIGLAKAIALTSDLPIVAVPTTYAGSELTPVWGITDRAGKKTGVDSRVLPVEVVYDVELTMDLPVSLTVDSALNSLAHCIDGLWAPGADPISDAFASEGIRRLASGLRQASPEGLPVEARMQLLIGACLGGVTLAGTGSGLQHKIAHVLGGALDLPHAALHATVLPYLVAFNIGAAPGVRERLGLALEAEDPLCALDALYRHVGGLRRLSDLNVTLTDVLALAPRIVEAAPPSNPRPVSEQAMVGLLAAAWSGAPWKEMAAA